MVVRPGYKQTEVGVIPADWEVTSIGNIASFRSGDGISIAALAEESSDAPIPVYGGNGIAGYTGRALVRESVVVVGRVGQKCGEVFLTGGPAWITDNALYPRSLVRGVNVRFLALALRAAGLNSVKNRNDLPLVTQSILHSVRIPLPPAKAEQEAIAEALSDADDLIESLEQLVAKKRRLKQGTMQELLTGKRRLPGFNGEWGVKEFGEVAQPRRERIDPQRTEPQEFCIELEHIEQGTGCVIGYTTTSESSSLKSVFHEGDVLFGKLRAYLRKYWLASCEGVCSTEIWALVAKQSLLIPHFLFQLVRLDRFIEAASSAYGTHMPRSDWNVLKNYEVVLPPLPEQAAIATILSDMDTEIAALEVKLAKARQLKQGMMQELLTGRIRLV